MKERISLCQFDRLLVMPIDLDMLTPAQLRAARAIVGWSRETLAEESGVAAVTCKLFEVGTSDPRLSTLQEWRRALEGAGVQFIEPDAKSEEGGAGVRLKTGARNR